ncbi:MAG: hypothetical protein AAFN94_07015 [Pseudomonadota bacterium]
MRLQLASYNEANFTSANDSTSIEQGILPRHVLQYAERVMEKVQLLRYMNGLSTFATNAAPVRDVTPADVHGMVTKIEAQTAELATAYGVDVVTQASLPSGKTPADVYGNLTRLSKSLDALGVPATVPNDVYRVARTLQNALDELARRNGSNVETPVVFTARPMTPADVYSVGLQVIDDLSQIAGDGRRFSVPGGVNSPGQKSGPIRPADVNKLLLRVLADVDAMKYSAGLRTASVKPPLEGGKTPTDVWRVLTETRAIIAALNAI